LHFPNCSMIWHDTPETSLRREGGAASGSGARARPARLHRQGQSGQGQG